MSSEREKIAPPDGKNLIVHLVVAVESWRFEDKMPRQLLTSPHGIQVVPDIPNYSWAEYGMRCGMPRLLEEFSNRGLRADACCNAGIIDSHPSVAEAILKAGWEFQGHGIHQRAMGEADEAELIAEAVEKLRSFTGVKPRGWIGPGLRETFDTPDLLRQNGIDYLCDWVIDDLPCWMTTKHGPMVVVPYTLELNDSVIYAVEKHSTPEMYNRLVDTLEALEPELEREPRVVTLSFHHHLSGVPHRMKYVRKMLDLLQSRSDAVFMVGGEISDWFVQAEQAAGRASD
ncbi:polysaccharide deacetylase family protein [soil metagenome]